MLYSMEIEREALGMDPTHKKKKNREGDAGKETTKELREFAGRLRRAREKSGKTQEQVAMAIGLSSYNSYQYWERAKRWPSAEYLASLCRVLEISSDELLGLISGEDQEVKTANVAKKNR